MESSLFSKRKMNRPIKKVIPWHAQQRYMESLSLLSFNQTISEAIYKKKIKSLQRNNKHLALALEYNRSLAAEKENLTVYNGKILDIINFSKVKLMDVATNMKQFTECIDETISLLNSSLTANSPKPSPNNSFKDNLKRKFQELSRNSPLEEVSENSDSFNKNAESNAQKGKISLVDDCLSSANKKCKLTKKGRTVKRNCENTTKSAEESSSAVPATGSKNKRVKNSKKCGSALDTNSHYKKKSLLKTSNIASASSSESPSASSNCSPKAQTKRESLGIKRNAVKVIAEAFLSQETENYHSPVSNEPNSDTSNPNLPCPIQDEIFIKKYFSSDLAHKQQSSASNSCGSQFSTISTAKVSNTSQCSSNSSNFSQKSFLDILEEEPYVLSSLENGDSLCGQTRAVNKMEHIEKGVKNVKQNNGICIKKTESEKDKRPYKSHNSKVKNRVQFYFDEDSIEKVDGSTIPPKDKIRKPMNKCKARKTVSHKKKSILSESTELKSNVLSDNISKLGKNSYLVTAEVHSPQNGISTQEIKSKMCNSEKMMPCVVLTDIFKSNQGLLSEMVGNSLIENGCLQKTIANSEVVPLAEINTMFAANNNSEQETNATLVVSQNSAYNMNDGNSAFMDCENTENRCLPEDREIIRHGKEQRPRKIQSYKEPPLNVKMRRLF